VEAFHPCPMTAMILCKPLESADLRLPVPTRQTGVGRGREEDGPDGAGPSRRCDRALEGRPPCRPSRREDGPDGAGPSRRCDRALEGRPPRRPSRREDGPDGAGPSRRRNIIWRVAFHAAGNLRRVDSAARRAAFQASEPRMEGGLSIRRLSRTSSASQPVRSFGEFQIQWITAPWIIRQHPWISQQSLGSGGIQVNVIADCHQRPFLRSASIRRRN
jgi:hypothetical protein